MGLLSPSVLHKIPSRIVSPPDYVDGERRTLARIVAALVDETNTSAMGVAREDERAIS
jgi:hypothetical protein